MRGICGNKANPKVLRESWLQRGISWLANIHLEVGLPGIERLLEVSHNLMWHKHDIK